LRLALLYPPDFAPPTIPFAALPLLNACAKRAGHQTLVMDVNAEAFSAMLYPENLELYYRTLDRLTADLKRSGARPAGHDVDPLLLLPMYPRSVVLEAPQAAADLRNPEIFYDPARHRHATRVIRTAHAFFDAMTPKLDVRNEHFSSALYDYMAQDVTEPYTEAYKYATIPKLAAFEPDLIAFSCPFSKQIGPALRLAKCIRQAMPRARFVIGGTGISDWQHIVLTDRRFYDYVDYSIVGDGEEALIDLLAAIAGSKPHAEVAGLWRAEGSEVVKPARMHNVDMDQNPVPDYHEVEFGHYMLPERAAFYTTTRGCYYNKCTFCPEGFRITFRMRSPERVYEDVRHLVREQGIRNIHFFDPLTPPRTLAYVSREAAREALPLRYHAEVKFEKIYTSREFVKTLAAGGCKLLQFGFESGVQRVLDAMKKGNNLEQIEIMLENLVAHDIVVGVTWFIGFPTEDEEDARETWRFVRRHENAIRYSLYTGTFGLGHDVPVFQHPEQYGIKVVSDASGNPTYRRDDGKDWDQEVLHRGFYARSDISLVNCGTALMYAANRPDLIGQVRGVGTVGPVSWEAPAIEERIAWVPPENGVLDLEASEGARYRIHVAQSGATFEADPADVALLNAIGSDGCELGALIAGSPDPARTKARLARLIDAGLLESGELVRVPTSSA
jgi:anaerobic magnesium-protoporphyrin IX monomethyl ester cyclase